jgi:hypothetical protein
MTFSIGQYMQDLTVSPDDEELEKAKDHAELTELICEDAWLARQAHFGVAGAMERQLEYLGGTLLPNAEQRISKMASDGVIGESYSVDSWFGTTNEDDPHINDEIAFDQQIDDQKDFAEGLRDRMRTAAIIMATNIRAHDDISKTLNQLTYGAIKAKASANRAARAA